MAKKSLISASHVARIIQEPVGKLLKLIHSGAITPDAVTMGGKLFLFDRERVESIRQRVCTVEQTECVTA